MLVDKNGGVYLAGLGNAHILPRPVAGAPESSASAGQCSRGHAFELTGPMLPFDTTNPIHPTKASDVYDFGVLAFEVRTEFVR